MPPPSTSQFDLASVLAKLQGSGLGDFLNTLRGGQTSPSTSPPPSQPPSPQPGPQAAPGWLSGNLDAAGRDPFHPYYAGFLNQPSSEDGMISFGGSRKPPAMITNEDGLLIENPMLAAFKRREAAGEEAQRQASSDESDALVDELSRQKARKDAAEDQAWAERSAQSSANFEADMQARGAQRSTQRRGGFLRLGRSNRGGARG